MPMLKWTVLMLALAGLVSMTGCKGASKTAKSIAQPVVDASQKAAASFVQAAKNTVNHVMPNLSLKGPQPTYRLGTTTPEWKPNTSNGGFR